MFYRIFGGNGHGKTSYIFDRLSECVKSKKKAFLVVPEQSAVDTEKRVIKQLGAQSNLYIEVINFKRLCNRVFRELGGLTSKHLDDGAKKMLMMLCLDEIYPQLKEYGKSAENAEFAEKALSFINEMNAGRISAKMLEDASEKLGGKGETETVAKKLSDLSLIAQAYEAQLSEIPGTVCDIYSKLCEKLRNDSFFDGTDVFFDAFYGFTETEYEIMSLIAEQADNVYVTFVCKKDCSDAVFERSIKAAKKCKLLAEKSGCGLSDIELSENKRHDNAKSVEHFEMNFSTEALTDTASDCDCDGSIEIVSCRNVYDEAKWALSKTYEFLRNGDELSDIVICAKNADDYIGVIDTVFQKGGIPLGVDLPETLSESALFELVTSALEGAVNFSRRPVMRYIKTGLSGLDEEEADLLEIYMRTWDITPAMMKSGEDFTMNPDGYVDSEPDEHTLAVVNSARKKVLVCLESLAENLKECKTVRDYCIAVYNLIQDIKRVGEREDFYDGNDGKSLALLYECLDSFSECAGHKRISLSMFLTLFKNCGKNYDTGHIPALSSQVRFSDVDLMRCDGVKHVILLGVNSGVFPSSCRSNSLISDDEKKHLKQVGISLSEDAKEKVFDELFLAYCAITCAGKSSHISYLREDVNSAALFPSVIITAVKKLCGCKVKNFKSDDFESCYSGDEMLFEEMTALNPGVCKNTLVKYFSEKDSYKERTESVLENMSQGDYLMPSTADAIYNNRIVTSYSRLEKMAGCPFSHFCTYVLKLKPEPKASLGPAEAGSVMHKILEELVPLLCTKDENGVYPDEDAAKSLVTKLLCRHLSRIAHTDISKVPKRFVYLYNRLSRMLFDMAVNIVRELRVTKFTPVDFELNISADADIKPFPIDIGDGCTLYIVGQIDRVDIYNKDGVSYVRIVDYKTGKKTFKLKDIQNGFNLQMLLYLASIRNGGKEKYGDSIVPAGVLYSNVVSSAVNVNLGDDDNSKKVSGPVASGIFLDDEEILMAMDPTENSIYLPIGRKNGEATRKDALTSLEEMGGLLDFVSMTAGELAKEMRKGLKSITPFDGKRAEIDVDPCRYCDMKYVCMGDVSSIYEEK
ncbi:MAG: hypothetical protein E7600_08630 [Ruminococcaceae bacterium]|nr:hypothetical protein [Oscillospiraceae bacterium]